MILTAPRSLTHKDVFWLLVILFGFFYSLQIPFITSNSDVLIYSLRSKSALPITGYAFYETDHSAGNSLPNYHIAHTIVLWAIYHVMPPFLQNSIWPAGLVSTISAALSVGLIFLIWLHLGLSQDIAIVASIFYGLIPAIWHHAIIGEVYALQGLAIYLFFYLYLRGRPLLSALAFALANLVSPLSALSFSLIVLEGNNSKKLKNIILVGLVALAIYFITILMLKIDIFSAFQAMETEQRPWYWKIYKLSIIIILNINLFLFYLFRGAGASSNTKAIKMFNLLVFVGISPYLLLALYDSQFLTENGSFLSIIFWACAYFISIGIWQKPAKPAHLLFGLAINIFLYLAFWSIPNQERSLTIANAATTLNRLGLRDTKVFGSWHHAVGTIIARDGWDLANINKNYIEISDPSEEDFLQTNEDSLLLIHFNREHFIARLSKFVFPNIRLNSYDPRTETLRGSLKQVYSCRHFLIFLWRKGEDENMD